MSLMKTKKIFRFHLPILTGDINIDTFSNVSNNLEQSYLDSITTNGFELLNKSATRISWETPNEIWETLPLK